MYREYPKREVFEIGEWESMFNLYQSLLTGDSTDNISGCGIMVEKVYGPKASKAGQTYTSRSGVGEKTAKALLESCETEQEMYDVCLKEYINLYPAVVSKVDYRLIVKKAKKQLLENIRLLFLIREVDEKGELVMYVPPDERVTK